MLIMLLVLCNHLVSYHPIRTEIIQEVGLLSLFFCTFFDSIVHVIIWKQIPKANCIS